MKPAPRASYASTVHEGSLYIVGGWNGEFAFTDGFSLDVESLHWHKLSIRPDASLLTNLILFASTAIDGTIYIHGGTSITNLADEKDDVLIFSIESSTLSRLQTTGTGPGPLSRHALAGHGNKLWVFGGAAGRMGNFVNDLYELELHFNGADNKWHRREASGFVPYPRGMHCAIALPRSYLVVTGGGDIERDFSDVYALDLRSNHWQRMHSVGGAAGLSQAACALLTSSSVARKRRHDQRTIYSRLVVHGGFGTGAGDEPEVVQNATRVLPLTGMASAARFLPAWQWVMPFHGGEPPSPRMGHALHPVNASCVVLFGGKSGDGHLNDVSMGVPDAMTEPPHAALAGEADDTTVFGSADDEDGGFVLHTARTAGSRRRKAKRVHKPRPSKQEL